MAVCYIGLGSNLDKPLQQITSAIEELKQLPKTDLLHCSPLYRSTAVGPGEQDDYINAVAKLTTQLSALTLLDHLQELEHSHNRIRIERWGPRTLDLDILTFGSKVIDHPRLHVPHRFLGERNFVIHPLYDIAPDLKLADGRSLDSLYKKSSGEGLTRLRNDNREHIN